MQARALFDFESGGPGELSFCTDELLTIVRQVGSFYYTLGDFTFWICLKTQPSSDGAFC